MAETSTTDKFTPQLRGPTKRQKTGVWTEEHAPQFYRPSHSVPHQHSGAEPAPHLLRGSPPSAGSKNLSSRQIIQELTAGPGDDDQPGPLPVSVHTRSLSPKEPDPDALLLPSSGAEDPPFKNELDSLQFALQRLQLSFPRVTSIDEQLKLASAINLITTSISRLVKTQKYITAHRPVEYNREIQAALEVVMKEWTRTA